MPAPAEVLLAEADARLEWFEGLVFEHPRMLSVRRQLLAALGTRVFHPRDDSDHRLRAHPVAVFGPTGVGKTTLMYSVKRMLLAQAASWPEFRAPGLMPVVSMECPSSRERGYDFNREHWIGLLIAMAICSSIATSIRTLRQSAAGRGRNAPPLAGSRAGLSFAERPKLS